MSIYGTQRPVIKDSANSATLIDFETGGYHVQRQPDDSSTENRTYVSPVTGYETVEPILVSGNPRYIEKLLLTDMTEAQKGALDSALIGVTKAYYYPHKDNLAWFFEISLIEYFPFPTNNLDPMLFENAIIRIRSRSYPALVTSGP